MQNGKDKHENASTQTGRVICSPLKAVDIECRQTRGEGLSKRAKKLRTVFGVSAS